MDTEAILENKYKSHNENDKLNIIIEIHNCFLSDKEIG